jgi:hypothetical protein
MRLAPLILFQFLLLQYLISYFNSVSAQDKTPIKFGKIIPADFAIKQTYDSGASALILADIGKSTFEGNNKGWFSLVFKFHRRVKILNKNGMDAATVKVLLYHEGSNEEVLSDVKAITYNLENGNIVQTKLEYNAIFNDNMDKNHTFRKFTLPAVKEGSIIEYSYTLTSDYLQNLQSWIFQDEYPCLWSEYEVDIPEFFQYVTIGQGYEQPEFKQSSYNSQFNVNISKRAEKNERVNLPSTVNQYHWIMKNIAAMKSELYTTSIHNFVSKIEFQMRGIRIEGQPYEEIMGDWVTMAQKLMKSEFFGEALDKNNGWMSDEIKKVLNDATDKLEIAKKIFAFIIDNFTCTDHSEIYIETNLKNVFKKRAGNVAEINLLLIAMLNKVYLTCSPVILSTRSNGYTSEIYPLLQRFNYVVAKLDIDGTLYYLDASEPFNGFGKLPSACYNGHGREITSSIALPVYFLADSLKEQKITSLHMGLDSSGGFSGFYSSRLGYYESFNLRKSINKNTQAEYFKNIKINNGFDIELKEPWVDSLKNPELPVTVHYDFYIKPTEASTIIYLTPLMGDALKKNPFQSADRKYPVSMPFSSDEIFVFNLDIPDGYIVDEMPKSARLSLNENEGMFEYLVQKSDNTVQLRSRIKFEKADFTPEDYSSLRDFFGFIVKKQSEQIVLKKKH